jgi:hypothetical protein
LEEKGADASMPPTTIPYQPVDSLFIVSGIAVISVALLFAERYVMRRQMRYPGGVRWRQWFASLLCGAGIWWLILGAAGLIIPLFFSVVLGYTPEDANGDHSILLGYILGGAGVLALVTIGLTLVLLLTGVGVLFYIKSRRGGYVEG